MRGKDPTFNRYSDKLKAPKCLMRWEVEKTALADVPAIESNPPESGNVEDVMLLFDSDICLRLKPKK